MPIGLCPAPRPFSQLSTLAMFRTASTLLVLPFALAANDTPQLQHTEGAAIERAFTVESRRSIDTSTLSLMGNDQDIGTGSERTSTLNLEVIDTIKKVVDGRATSFVRAFDAVSTEAATEGMEESEGVVVRDDDGASELEGAAVAFTWDADAEEWKLAFDEDTTGDDDWLEDLDQDLDLARLFPDDAKPEVGDSWDLDGEFLMALLNPGGTVEIQPEDDDSDLPEGGIALTIPSADASKHWEDLEGEVVATYAEIVEEDPRLARIVIKVDVSSEVDLVEMLEEEASERGVDETYSEAITTRELAGEITVLWDLGANRLHSLSGEIEGPVELSATWSLDAGGMELEVSYEEIADQTFAVEASISE